MKTQTHTTENMLGKDVPPNAPKFEPVEGSFGCCSCLWACIECKNGSLYKPSEDSLCESYTYYD